MPGSMPYNVSRIVQLARTLTPRSILDVGCGFGKYGVLFREALDIIHGRYHKRDWKIRIDAVEVFSPYLNVIHEYIYDDIYHCDIREFDWDKEYDLVFMGDVIEHFTKEEGLQILDSFFAKHVLLSTPDHFSEAPNTYMDNVNEEHRYVWKPEDFKDLEKWNLKAAAADRYMQTILLEKKE